MAKECKPIERDMQEKKPLATPAPPFGAPGTAARYIFVCGGPDCTAKGSDAVRDALDEHLQAAGTADAEIVSFGCLGHCSHAVNLVLFPEGTWYGNVGADDAAEIAEHIAGGSRVGRRVLETVEPWLRELIFLLFQRAIEEQR